MHAVDDTDVVASLARPEARSLPLYDAGVTDAYVRARYGVTHVARLATNESPVGASPAALHALHEASVRTAFYPDPACSKLRQTIGAQLDAAPERITIGNGSENVLETLCQAFLSSGDDVVTLAPSFGLHEIYPRMMGARVRKVAVSPALKIDIEAWEQSLRSPHKLVLLSNPSNPVGCIVDRDALARLVRAVRADALLVIDEAYYEYAAPNPAYANVLRELAVRTGPWTVLRTFSKAHGLAGLRVGYAIASDRSIVELIDRVRTPYNVNGLAQEAAVASLQDAQHVAMGVAFVCGERERLAMQLHAAGFTVAPSDANFLFFDARRDSRSVALRLLERGVMVKPWREPGYETFIRVTIGTASDNDLFMTALRACLPLRSQESG